MKPFEYQEFPIEEISVTNEGSLDTDRLQAGGRIASLVRSF
ncbi:MAG: hypothetical protein ACOYOS_03115 [Syntrophales bacterium]